MSAVADAASVRSGKGSGDENFPVASVLIRPRHRPAIMAFYTYVRTADDVADHATMPAEEKLALLDRMSRALTGGPDTDASARVLRDVLAAQSLSPRHALDLITAFKTDCTKSRYADWDDLIGYCRYSAMPVGRYVLDVHGEGEAAWPASDALCAALQVINHLQDCGKDFRDLDRVYIPDDVLRAERVGVEALGEPQASPALRRVIADLAARTQNLLAASRPFAGMIRDRRLGLEVAIIQAIAEKLAVLLSTHDPLSETVHFSKARAGLVAASAALRYGFARKVAR